MKKIITILTLLCSFGLKSGAQQYLSREAYRDKVEAYSQSAETAAPENQGKH